MLKKTDRILAEALVEKGLIAKEQMDALVQEYKDAGEGLQTILLNCGLFGEKDILIVLAGKLRLPYVPLKELTVEKFVLNKIPMKIASYYGFVPLNISGRILTIAVAAPLEIRTRDEIRIQLGYEIQIVLAEQSNITDILEKWRALGADTVKETAVPPQKKIIPEGIVEEVVPWTPKDHSLA